MEAGNCVYDTEETVPELTLLELLPEYLDDDRGTRVSVVRHALVVREFLLVHDFPVFVDCVLLMDIEGR